MATTAMPTRVLNLAVTSPQASPPMPIPTRVSMPRSNSESVVDQNRMNLAELSSIDIASIVRIISWVTMPKLALWQPSIMFTTSIKPRNTAQISQTTRVNQKSEHTNRTPHQAWANDRARDHSLKLQRFQHLCVNSHSGTARHREARRRGRRYSTAPRMTSITAELVLLVEGRKRCSSKGLRPRLEASPLILKCPGTKKSLGNILRQRWAACKLGLRALRARMPGVWRRLFSPT